MPHPRKIPIEKLTSLITKVTEGTQGLLLTDRQLLHAMNKSMKRCERISYRTFQRYKTAVMVYGEAELDEREKFDDIYADLYDALMDNEIAQKLALYEKMLTADAKQSRDYKWIMERKFPDMNIRLQTMKEMASYEVIDHRIQQDDLQQYKKELAADQLHDRQEALRQKIRAEREPQPVIVTGPEPTLSLDAPTPEPTPTNYSELWIRPDGTRRTREEFLRAVKARKTSA